MSFLQRSRSALIAALCLGIAIATFMTDAAGSSTTVRVSVFNYPGLNGTVNGDECANENSNLLSIIHALPGFDVDGTIQSFGGSKWLDGTKPASYTVADFEQKLASSQFFFMPDMEREDPSDTTFFPVDARTVLRNWVDAGGVMVMTGTASAGARAMMNLTFGWNLQSGASSPWAKQTANTAGTPFDTVPASSLRAPSATDAISNANGSVADFTPMWGTSSNATVAVMRSGSGYVIFLGFDFYNTGAPGVPGVTTYANDGRRTEDEVACSNYSASTSSGSTDSIWVSGVLPAALEYASALSSADLKVRTDTAATVEYTSSETGTTYAVLIGEGEATPSAAQIKAGLRQDGTAALATLAVATTGNQALDLAFAGLTPLTSYAIHAVTEYGSPAAFSAIESITFTTRASAPTDVTITPSDQSLSVAFTAPAGAVTNYEYSIDGGATWTTRSPVATTSPIVISGLTNNTEYQVAIRAVVAGDPGVGSATFAATPNARAVVTSTSVAGITMTSADLSATVTSSETTVSARGFVIATTDGPTLGAAGVTDVAAGTGTGAVTATPTGLTRGTTYYVRAYATNTAGTAYGATQVFSTAPNAIATTAGTVRWFDGPTIVDAGVTVEGEDLAGATVSIDNNATGDVLACPDTSATGITCAYSAATGVLTLTGSATAATYQTVLRGVTFEATDVGTVVTTRSVTFNLGGSLTFDPATGHYYEIVTVSSSGATYAGGAQDPDGTQGDLGGGSGISWEEARCRAKYSNARFGGTLMVGSKREVGRTTQAADGCVALDGSSPLETRTLNGLSGHLANITALTEHQFLRTKLTGTGWIGGADVDTEGTWIWMDGPEAGEVFWIQGTTSTRRGTNSISGVDRFNYWSDGEPNDAGGEHWAEFGFGNAGVGSSWNDCRNSCGPRTRYVVEYSASGGVVPPVLSASRSMSPLPAQTITFNTATELVYGASAPSLTATSSSGLAVTLAVTSGDGTTCTLTGTTLTWVAPGSCTVTATQAGDDSDGGVQPAPPVARTITMARRPLPITGLTATARAYDGTSTVGVTGTPTFDPADLVAADVGAVSVGGSPTATLSSAVAGVARAATVSGLTLSGARAFAYEPTATLSVDIAPRQVRLDGTFAVADRGFDGTSAVTPSSQSLTLRAGDVLAGDVAALGLGTVTFAADSAAAGTRTATPTAATLTGARSGDYVVVMTDAPTATFTITAVPLTIASGSFSVADKVYDGTDVATVSAHSLVLTGFAAGDSMADIAWTPSGRFTLDTAGTGRTVELVGGAVFGGAKGGGYTLDVTGAPTATASITPRPVTVTGASAAPRPYDGTTAVAVSGATLGNTVAGDVVSLANATSGVAASRNAGTQAVSTSMTLSGADAANYRLSGQPSLSVTITPLPVSVTMNALPSRPYDGASVLTLSPSAFSVNGVLPGESIAVSGTGRLSSRAAGTRTLTVAPTYTPGGGVELSNYQLPASVSGTVTITPLALRIVGATVTSRAWDGSTEATITGAALEGVRAGDAVSLAAASSGQFATAQPGTHAVRFTPALVGVDAINYTLTVPELTGTITRAPATLRITGGLTQFADGSPRAIRVAVSPSSAGRAVVSYGGGGAPTEPGSYPVTVTLDSPTHEATALNATLTVEPVESLSDVVAARADGTLALPEIGPVLEADGTSPALRPTDRRVLEDGEPVDARMIVIEDRRIRVEAAGDFAIELQAAIGEGESRIPLPVDVDGTLLLYRGGFVDVGGSRFLAGSTAEVWMFSNATLLGTAIVGSDGSFAGSFPVDELLEVGEHTIQINGVAPDGVLRSASLGVRIEDLEDSARERFVFASERGDDTTIASSPAWLLLVAALIGAGAMRWWIVGRRRRDDELVQDGTTA